MRNWNPKLKVRVGENGMNGWHLPEVQNYCFDDILEITNAFDNVIWFKSLLNQKTYRMYMSDFNDVIRRKKIDKTSVSGKFSFTKKGMQTGLILL